MVGRPYDNRRSKAEVFVNSSFILNSFKKNISSGFYGDAELERLTRKLIMELWRRDPALLEKSSKLVAQKYGDYIKDTYGKANFKKKLIADFNKRKTERIRRENEQMMKALQECGYQDALEDTMFNNEDI